MGNSKHEALPPFYHRDWVFLGLTNTAGALGGEGGGGGGAVSTPMGVLGCETP